MTGTNPDLDCGDIPTQYKPIRITGPDYHALDRDGDGLGADVLAAGIQAGQPVAEQPAGGQLEGDPQQHQLTACPAR